MEELVAVCQLCFPSSSLCTEFCSLALHASSCCNAAGKVIALHFLFLMPTGDCGGLLPGHSTELKAQLLLCLRPGYFFPFFFFFFVSCLLYQSQSWDLFIGWDSEYCVLVTKRGRDAEGTVGWCRRNQKIFNQQLETPEGKGNSTPASSFISQPAACKYRTSTFYCIYGAVRCF